MSRPTVKFEAPPRQRTKIRLPEWASRLEQLRERPGEWGKMYETLHHLPPCGNGMSNYFRSGRIPLPEGVWEFATRRKPGSPGPDPNVYPLDLDWDYRDHTAFYGRYLGQAAEGGTWLVSGRQGNPPYRIDDGRCYPALVAASAA